MYVAFISDQFLKDNTWVNQSVDPSIMRPTVRMAQEKYILPILGTGLYNKVISLISGAPTVTLSGDYGVMLHEYIQPCLLWYALAESTIPISLRIVNKGIVKKNSENSTPADLNEILAVKDEARNNAQWYAQRLMNFTAQNRTLYTEYDNPGSGIDTIFPDSKAFSTVLSLDNYCTKSSLNRNGSSIPIDYGRNKDCCT